ncbi:MAG: hypothetical protein Unbinned1473contig1001_42 [Prokaryotic dsDNA virus sp.]|mgnify:CR=1 FL=1|nr:MAG: hypothetical protein Unbinned1473contig1001_42 [Prokaryotic dsDNA virus sp.]|tara:strand:+ start:8673 stop:9065 length:393 start_codon:yes stop_codon:yes gene_type:complete
MFSVTIKNDYDQAVEAFNNELNDYFEREVENVRPYSSDNPMLSYVNEFEDALNDGTDLTWELGKKTRTGYVASFAPSEAWQEKHLEIDDGSNLQIDMRSPKVAYIKIGNKTVYLDNSTGEQIVEIYEGED